MVSPISLIAIHYRDGSVDSCAAFHEISRLFGLYLTFRTGFAAREMTATDLEASPLAGAAVPVLALTYPGQFETADPHAVQTAVDAARKAVATYRRYPPSMMMYPIDDPGGIGDDSGFNLSIFPAPSPRLAHA